MLIKNQVKGERAVKPISEVLADVFERLLNKLEQGGLVIPPDSFPTEVGIRNQISEPRQLPDPPPLKQAAPRQRINKP